MEEVTWVEVVHRRDGVVERRRIEERPLVVGRGYGADLIVDDPQVCAAHVRISRDDTGALTAQDLSSVNGTWAEGRERVGRAVLHSGATLRIGQTQLRFFGPEAPVAATEPAPASGWDRLVRPRVLPLLLGAAALVATVDQYADDYARVTAAKLTGQGLGVTLALVCYAAVWAFVSRVVARRFNFRAHLAVASLASLALFVVGGLTSYAEFLLPDRTPLELASGALWLGLGAVVLGAHLALAATLSRRRLRAVVGVFAAVVLAFVGVSALGDEEFTSVPRFSAAVKPVGLSAAATSTVDEFVGEGTELRNEVDRLAKQRPTGR